VTGLRPPEIRAEVPYRLWRRRGGDAAALRQIEKARYCCAQATIECGCAIRKLSTRDSWFQIVTALRFAIGQSITGCERKFGCALKQIPSGLYYPKRSAAWNFFDLKELRKVVLNWPYSAHVSYQR
jgi:hypothetical protein